MTRFLQLTVLVWVNQYLLQRIGPEEYSLLPLVMSLVLFGDLFRNIFVGGIARYLVEADAKGDDDEVTRITSSMTVVLSVVALVLAGLGGFAIWKLDVLLNIERAYLFDGRVMLFLLVAMLCANVALAPFVHGLYVKQRFVIANAIDLVSEVIRIGILLVLLLGVSTKVMWLVLASVSAGVLNLAAKVWITRRLVPAVQFRRGSVAVATARRLLSFSAWTSVQGITNLINQSIPALLLNRFSTSTDVSAFHLGRLPDLQIRRMTAAVAMPAQPALTSIYAREGEGSLHDLYYQGGRYHLWFSLLLVAPLVSFASEIVELYVGRSYAAAAIVVVAFLATYPFIWASAMFYRVAHAVGRVRAYYLCTIFVEVAIVAALVYVVRGDNNGAGAMAIAMALATAVLHVVVIWPMGLALIGGSWRRFAVETVIPGVLPFVGAVAMCEAVAHFVDIRSWAVVALVSCVSAAAYLLILAICMQSDDRALFTRAKTKVAHLLAPTPRAVA